MTKTIVLLALALTACGGPLQLTRQPGMFYPVSDQQALASCNAENHRDVMNSDHSTASAMFTRSNVANCLRGKGYAVN